MKKILMTLSILIILGLVIYSQNFAKTLDVVVVDENDKSERIIPVEVEVDNIQEEVDKMTIDEKIAQIMIVGFTQSEMNEELKTVLDNKFSGLIFFTHNIKSETQTKKLITDIKKYNESISNKPLFLSVDEEGGSVSRMPRDIKKLKSAHEYGSSNDTEIGLKVGESLGVMLKDLGFNLNFAPVVDVHSNPKNPIIGKRAISSDPFVVSNISEDIMKGMLKEGVIPTAKHFPGHGDTSTDSHYELPVVNKTKEQLYEMELIPYLNKSKDVMPVVMVGHLLVTNIDDKNPASLSKEVITSLLRTEIGYDGVIITDDLTMGALSSLSIGERAVKSFNAGSDILLVCKSYKNIDLVKESLRKAVNDESISIQRLDESVYRILELKYRY